MPAAREHVPGRRADARRVAQIAVFAALSVVVRRFLTPPISGLNLGGFPLVMSGLVIGPVSGAWVGAISDLVGAQLAPHGSYDPVYTCTAMLTAAVPALMLRGMRETWVPRLPSLMASMFVGQVLTKCAIIPLYQQYLTGVPFALAAAKAFGVQLLHVPIYAILAQQILRALPPGDERRAAV